MDHKSLLKEAQEEASLYGYALGTSDYERVLEKSLQNLREQYRRCNIQDVKSHQNTTQFIAPQGHQTPQGSSSNQRQESFNVEARNNEFRSSSHSLSSQNSNDFFIVNNLNHSGEEASNYAIDYKTTSDSSSTMNFPLMENTMMPSGSLSNLKAEIYECFSKESQRKTPGHKSIRDIKFVTQIKNTEHKYQKLSIGEPNNKEFKVILMVGATGSGKTTLLNAFVNFIYGVEYEDNFRFKLEDGDEEIRDSTQSQTDIITAYTFYYKLGMKQEFNFVLIDTPGLGDTRGVEMDKALVDRLCHFMTCEQSEFNYLNGICFVVQSSCTRLTPEDKYIFDSITSLFAKNVSNLINIMVTFADSTKPEALKTLEKAEVIYNQYYKFNNCALFSSNDDEDEAEFKRTYYNMVIKSISQFFTRLGEINAVSLEQTVEVLETKNRLQNKVRMFHANLSIALSKLKTLKQERDMLKRLDTSIEENSNYEEEVDDIEYKEVFSEKNTNYNCKVCKTTCCVNCNGAWWSKLLLTFKLYYCDVFENKKCTVCTNKCPYANHVYEKSEHTYVKVRVKRTLKEIYARYESAVHDKKSKQLVFEKMEFEFKKIAREVLNLIKGMKLDQEQLSKKALHANNLSMKDYFESLIEAEKDNLNEDSQSKIKVYEVLLKNVRALDKISELGKHEVESEDVEKILDYFTDIV